MQVGGGFNLLGNAEFHNEGILNILGNYSSSEHTVFMSSCKVFVNGDWANAGKVFGQEMNCGGFEIKGNATNLEKGVLGAQNTLFDICLSDSNSNYLDLGVSESNVSQCSCSNECIVDSLSSNVLVYNDLNKNCVNDLGENGLNNIKLKVLPIDKVYTTNMYGNVYFNTLPDGEYQVVVDTSNIQWEVNCQNTVNFSVNNGKVDKQIKFDLISNFPCPSANISVHMPRRRVCMDNQIIYLSACNDWTATSTLVSSYIEVRLPEELILDNASLPFTDLGEGLIKVETGDLLPGQCVNVQLYTTVSCDAIMGKSLCIEANLYPKNGCESYDTLKNGNNISSFEVLPGNTSFKFPEECEVPWDKSSLSVKGWCSNDSIYFTVTNTGEPIDGDMQCFSSLWITVDGILSKVDSIKIAGGATQSFSFLSDGKTWQLNVEQHPLHPGNSHPNAIVEACGNDLGDWTPGVVNKLSFDDAELMKDIFCGEVQNSYDPNDKRGFPIGLTDEHLISNRQSLGYVIRFQNTGNDTAYNIIIRDTLNEKFNVFSVVPKVASHSYTFKVYDSRILEWTFSNIDLPDSNVNEPASNGFLTFSVDLVNGLEEGVIVKNKAEIYFDFNDPIITNETMHTINYGFPLLSSTNIDTKGNKDFFVYPNPTSDYLVIVRFSKNILPYKIVDLSGRVIKEGELLGYESHLSMHDIPPGLYLLSIENGGAKKIIVR